MTHLIDGEFQSDKYPETPRGLMPLKLSDPMAQDLLWIYAQRRREVDSELAADLETGLLLQGFEPPPGTGYCGICLKIMHPGEPSHVCQV